MPRWMFISVAAVLAITTLAARQQVFRTAVEYVSVDVVVTDKNDKPVTDLTKDEFVIKENNKAQTIRDFQYVSVPVEHRTVDVAQPQPPEPDVVTNMPPTPKSRLFAVVIDDLHLIEQDIIPIKRVLTDFVESVSPDDEVAMVFVGRSDLSINFTQNTGRLLATIENVRKSLGFGLDALAQEPAAGASPTASGAIAMKSAPIRLNYARSAAMTLGSVAA